MTSSPAPDLDELERLAEAATPGPWVEQHDEPIERTGFYVDSHALEAGPEPVVPPIHASYSASFADAAYIAAASPDVILALIQEVRAARAAAAESGRLREALRLLQDGMREAGPGGSLNLDHQPWRYRAARFLATPPAPSDHGALDVERLARAMEVISFHMMPRHPGAEFAQAIAAEYARLGDG